MAVLPDADRALATAQWMRDQIEATAFTKADLRAALNAADAWVDSNASAYNTALPAAFRTTATTGQKALLLCYVVLRRSGRLPTEGG